MYGGYELMGSMSAVSQIMYSQEEKFSPGYCVLPQHLQVSYESSRNPWQNLLMQDFILVAEFSELEGPRPLFSIPEDAGEVFDKNAFAVHVMSVDYQTKASHSFSLVEDTQLIFSEDRENIYAYVHHFILYDIEARGFVRPFCMCYISNSKRKILSNLEHFIQEFSEISKIFKSANRPLFRDDLMQRLADLSYMKDCLEDVENERSEWIEFPKNADKNFYGLNIEMIESMMTETKRAINVLDTSKQDAGSKDYLHSVPGTVEDSGNETDNFTEPTDTSDGDFSNEDQVHDEVVQRLLRERRRHTLTLRDLYALCGHRTAEGVVCLQKLHQYFYQRYEVFSVIEEETPLLESFSSVLMVGGSFVMNFQEKVSLSSAEHIPCPSRSVGEDSCPRNSYESARSALSTESFQTCEDENKEVYPDDHNPIVYTPFHTVTSQDLLGRNDCVDSAFELNASTSSTTCTGSSTDYGRLSSENSQDPNEENNVKRSTAVDVALLYPALAGGGDGLRRQRSSTGDLPSRTDKPAPPIQRQFSAIETQSSYMKALLKNAASNTIRSDIIRSDVLQSWIDIEHVPLGSTPQYKVIYKDIYSNSEACSTTGPAYDRSERMYVQCYAQQLYRRKTNGPGGGIVFVLRKYGYLVHLLYALLSGRTVIILANPGHQGEVRSLITSLWLFVPGHFRRSQQVVLWRTKQFRLADLGRFKLVGLSKSKQFNVLPYSVETYVTTLDYESGCLKTPPYQGEFLNQMLKSRSCWKSDSMFLAYINCVFLEMSLKAFICYYATCLTTSTVDANRSWEYRSLVPRDVSLEYMTDILDALGILGSDANIILYFVDLICQQQLMDVTPRSQAADNISFDSFHSSSSYDHSGACNHTTTSRPITLDFTQCTTYKKSRE